MAVDAVTTRQEISTTHGMGTLFHFLRDHDVSRASGRECATTFVLFIPHYRLALFATF